MKKLIIIAIACTTLFTGCSWFGGESDEVLPITVHKQGNSFELGGIYTFQDPQTGVWYYASYKGGTTERYNRDGTLYAGDRP